MAGLEKDFLLLHLPLGRYRRMTISTMDPLPSTPTLLGLELAVIVLVWVRRSPFYWLQGISSRWLPLQRFRTGLIDYLERMAIINHSRAQHGFANAMGNKAYRTRYALSQSVLGADTETFS